MEFGANASVGMACNPIKTLDMREKRGTVLDMQSGYDNSADRIRGLFGGIAGRYDLGNRLLSFGMDGGWRRVAVSMAEVKDGERLLDMCCGTGDLAFSFAEGGGVLERIVGCDLSGEMVELAKAKEKKLRGRGGLLEFEWAVGDCTASGYESGSFDIISCGFGVRNMEVLSAGLGEMYRLLREEGRACILEFSLPEGLLMRWLYLMYLSWLLPVLGGIISGRFGAYRYLAKSVRQWAEGVDLEAELKTAGFGRVVTRKMSMGAVTVYVAYKGE